MGLVPTGEAAICTVRIDRVYPFEAYAATAAHRRFEAKPTPGEDSLVRSMVTVICTRAGAASPVSSQSVFMAHRFNDLGIVPRHGGDGVPGDRPSFSPAIARLSP